MNDAPKLFAALANALDDLHAIAVTGSDCDLSPDIHEALLGQTRLGLSSAYVILLHIAASLP